MSDIVGILCTFVSGVIIGMLLHGFINDTRASDCNTIQRTMNIETVYVHANKTCYIVEKDGKLTPFKTVEFKVN